MPQRRRHPLLGLVLILFMLLSSACSEMATSSRMRAPGGNVVAARTADEASTFLATTPTLAVSAAVAQPVAQATPTPPATPEKALVSVWWPDDLYPAEDTDAATILNSQIELFRLTYTSYDVELRRKRTNGLGGIMATLRTAAPVAPGAMPDLTLMRRTDMITAAKEGLIVPLDEWVPTDLAGANLFAGTRSLGEVDGELYGVPYALMLYHTVYRLALFDQPPFTFDDVLEAGTPFVFPGGSTPVSWTVLLQYISAGGRLVDANGNPALSPDALLVVLDFYAHGLEGGVFTSSELEHLTFSDYWNAFVTGEANLASVNSPAYLNAKTSVQNVGLAPVPSLSGLPLTMLDGWMWVVTTQNPDRQQRALAFLSWMMRVSQHGAFTEALGVLPSQIRALRLWDDQVYAAFAQDLIAATVVLPEERRNNAAAVALQSAVTAVLKGVAPEDAASDALFDLGQ